HERKASNARIPEAIHRARVDANLVGQPLRVQAPALDEGGGPAEPPERGQVAELLGDRQLEVMARHPLVKGERLRRVAWPRPRKGGVDVVAPRAAAVRGGLTVVGDRRMGRL